MLGRVANRLCQEPWFKESWLVDVHFFPAAPQVPESVTMHVSRPHWFNEDGQGIHFEVQFGPKQWAKSEISLMLHVFHCATIPGTKIKRIAVTKPFIDSNYDLIASWPGYSFRAGRYGTQSFSCTLVLAEHMTQSRSQDAAVEEQFALMVSNEILRLCRTLGPAIDQALATALGSA
ncbi:hypothetical protein BH11CYA1_BH11CYA1_15360 [soil metagenome]